MALFPPVPVTIVLDGSPLRSYNGAYETAGHVYAPLRPYVTSIADRMWFDGDVLVIVRDGRMVSIRMQAREPDALDYAYVPVAAILRSLGELVRYDGPGRMTVQTPQAPLVSTPTPFDPAEPSASPRPVFTPVVPPTPRPVWTGSPLPRRTPLPFPTARP